MHIVAYCRPNLPSLLVRCTVCVYFDACVAVYEIRPMHCANVEVQNSSTRQAQGMLQRTLFHAIFFLLLFYLFHVNSHMSGLDTVVFSFACLAAAF